jgi:hypothetical protein
MSDQEATIWLDGRFIFYRIDRTSNERADMGVLVCANHRSMPPDSDSDQIVRTILNFDDTFAVTHVSRSGKAYLRGDQYKDVKVWYDEKSHWSGVWKRNSNKRMTGTLVFEGDTIKYIEETYDGGRLETTMVSMCEKEEEVSTSAKPSSSSANAAAPAEYECAGYRSVPPESVERDPVVKTSVTIPLSVTHTTLAGEVYARVEQYRDVRTWSDRKGDYWSGISIKNPSRTMVGHLAYDDSRGISARLYVEKSFVNGRLERTTTSTWS